VGGSVVGNSAVGERFGTAAQRQGSVAVDAILWGPRRGPEFAMDIAGEWKRLQGRRPGRPVAQ